MAINVHDHGDPNPVATVVEDPALLVPVPPPAPPPLPTVKEVAASVDLAEVVDKKR